MNDETVEILRNELDACAGNLHPDTRAFTAQEQAKALAKAAEGTITISAEGLPSRGELWDHLSNESSGRMANLYARVITALPALALPTAAWSVVASDGSHWMRHEPGDDSGRDWAALGEARNCADAHLIRCGWTLIHDAGSAA